MSSLRWTQHPTCWLTRTTQKVAGSTLTGSTSVVRLCKALPMWAPIEYRAVSAGLKVFYSAVGWGNLAGA